MTSRRLAALTTLPIVFLALACEKAPPEPEPRPAMAGEPAPKPKTETKADAIPAPDNVAKPPEDAETTDSGLASIVLKEGEGSEKPGPTDTVKVHYTGWTTKGEMFDSSVQRGEPTTFALNGVIKGWTEGVQLMTEGEKRRFWIPADLAYGEKPARPGAPSGQLTFDIELIEIVEE